MSLQESVTATAPPSVWDALSNLISQFPILQNLLTDVLAAAQAAGGSVNWISLIQILGTAVAAGSGWGGIISAILTNLAVILAHPATTGTRSMAIPARHASGESVAAVARIVEGYRNAA